MLLLKRATVLWVAVLVLVGANFASAQQTTECTDLQTTSSGWSLGWDFVYFGSNSPWEADSQEACAVRCYECEQDFEEDTSCVCEAAIYNSDHKLCYPHYKTYDTRFKVGDDAQSVVKCNAVVVTTVVEGK